MEQGRERKKRRKKKKKKEKEDKVKIKVWNPLFWVFGMSFHGELMLLGLGFWKRSLKP